jgi:hypothetical protein
MDSGCWILDAGDEVAEGVVFVRSGEVAGGGIDQGGDVAVAVETGKVGRGKGQVAGGEQQSADAASALLGAGQVQTPDVASDY